MSPILKAILIVVGGYFATLAAAGVASLLLLIVLEPRGCAAVGRALMGIWSVLAVSALLSSTVVGMMLWKLALGNVTRVLLSLGYAVVLLGSFASIALLATIAMNC